MNLNRNHGCRCHHWSSVVKSAWCTQQSCRRKDGHTLRLARLCAVAHMEARPRRQIAEPEG